jgi:hypothetical protein
MKGQPSTFFKPPQSTMRSPIGGRDKHMSFFSNVYFSLLDASMIRLFFCALFFYGFACFVLVVLTVPVSHNFVTPDGDGAIESILAAQSYPGDDDIDPSTTSPYASPARWSVAMRVVVAHVVTMGQSGDFTPLLGKGWLFIYTSFQQLLGIFCNVFVLAILLRKFELPVPALIFSPVVLVTRRNGIPVLLIRVGNLRCNCIQKPEPEINLFSVERTSEGETRVKCQKLEVRCPPIMYGQCVVEHEISAESPLFPFLEAYSDADFSDHLTVNDLSICVLFQGFDITYYESIISNYKYGPKDFVLARNGEKVWADMMVSGGGQKQKPTVDFKAIGEVVDRETRRPPRWETEETGNEKAASIEFIGGSPDDYCATGEGGWTNAVLDEQHHRASPKSSTPHALIEKLAQDGKRAFRNIEVSAYVSSRQRYFARKREQRVMDEGNFPPVYFPPINSDLCMSGKGEFPDLSDPNVVYVISGGKPARWSGNDTNYLLSKMCAAAYSLEVLLRQANIPHQNVVVDLVNKHPWFIGEIAVPLDFLPPNTKQSLTFPDHGVTPMLCYGGKLVGEFVDIVRWLTEEFSENFTDEAMFSQYGGRLSSSPDPYLSFQTIIDGVKSDPNASPPPASALRLQLVKEGEGGRKVIDFEQAIYIYTQFIMYVLMYCGITGKLFVGDVIPDLNFKEQLEKAGSDEGKNKILSAFDATVCILPPVIEMFAEIKRVFEAFEKVYEENYLSSSSAVKANAFLDNSTKPSVLEVVCLSVLSRFRDYFCGLFHSRSSFRDHVFDERKLVFLVRAMDAFEVLPQTEVRGCACTGLGTYSTITYHAIGGIGFMRKDLSELENVFIEYYATVRQIFLHGEERTMGFAEFQQSWQTIALSLEETFVSKAGGDLQVFKEILLREEILDCDRKISGGEIGAVGKRRPSLLINPRATSSLPPKGWKAPEEKCTVRLCF